MRVHRWGTVGGLLLTTLAGAAFADTTPEMLRVYGPGGPHHVLKECAALYREMHGESVAILKARPEALAKKIREDGDIFYAGAEYMLEDFERTNPGLLDLSSSERLHPRRVGIIVRKGNPLDIRGVDDLKSDAVKVLRVALENMTPLLGDSAAGGISYWRRVYTGDEGVSAWRTDPAVDAWVTYKSWYLTLAAEADFVDLPGGEALRFTPVTITRRTPRRHAALRFVAFLKSPEAQRVFHEHGWE